jgi:hypothetical protein
MIVKDILWSAREDYLDDTVAPFLWSDELLLRHLNTVLNEWCRETGCIRDWTTPSICKILILANQHTYPMDSRITEIHKGYLEHGAPVVLPKNDEWLDNELPSWRRETGAVIYMLPDYGQNFFRVIRYPNLNLGYWSGAFIFTGLSGTIAHAIGTTEGNFSTLLKVTDQVVISGTLLNGTLTIPKVFTIASVSTSSFTVSETLADETVATGGIIQKVIDTLWLTVSRLPLLSLTSETQSPEIRSDYHPYLIHGICREAWGKQDSQTLDKEKSKEQRGLFEDRKRQARAERDWLRYSEVTMKPHPGAL